VVCSMALIVMSEVSEVSEVMAEEAVFLLGSCYAQTYEYSNIVGNRRTFFGFSVRCEDPKLSSLGRVLFGPATSLVGASKRF